MQVENLMRKGKWGGGEQALYIDKHEEWGDGQLVQRSTKDE
jgi:hypothetical protein